jgi:predicted nucleic acid-binding protein
VKYLVDANVLSEPTKASPDPRVIEWLRANEPDIAVDPIILGELRFGILILPKGSEPHWNAGSAPGLRASIVCPGMRIPV